MKHKALLFRLCALVAAMMCTLGASAAEAYANLIPADSTLTFYYDNLRSTRTGTTYDLNTGSNMPEWSSESSLSSVTRVVFDSSFRDARPTSTFCWFYNFVNLTSITGWEYLNTSEVTNMTGMFFLCYNMTNLDVSHFNTANVTNMGSMFDTCSGLTSLDVSCFNTAKVTDMAYMFEGCAGLTDLDLSCFNTSKVTDMSFMFNDNPNLSTIYVGSGWNTDAVTSSPNMFYKCYSLVGGMGTTYNARHVGVTYAHIDGGPSNPGYFTAGAEAYAVYTSWNTTLTFYYDNLRSTRTGWTFDLNEGDNKPDWCSEGMISPVQTVVFDPSFAGARPTTTYCWFKGMYNISTISGMEYLNTSEVTNMSSMFEACSYLTSLDLRNFDTKKVTDMSEMFYHCYGLTSLDVSSFITENVTDMGEMFYNCSNLASLDVSNFNTGNVTDMAGMFSECKSLPSLDLSNFNTAKVTNMWFMFSDCTGLPSLDLSSFNTANVTNMAGMFYGCPGLPSLDLSSFNTTNVTNMAGMFYECSGLTSLDLSSFNTANVTDMEAMFNECPGLTSLDLSSFNTSKVTNMYYMFYNCSSLTTIYVGDGWSTAAVTDSEDMFTGCTKIRGGAGTTYDASHVDKAYAHIDGGTSNPGYFTAGAAAYACYTSSNTTLTFYCDSQRNSRPGTIYDLNTGSNNPGWYTDGTRSSVTNVVFDASFADARPTTTFKWFREMKNLTTIVGMKEYLNTSQVTSMKAMFFECRALPSVDLTHFMTENVTDMSGMFGNCVSLTSLDLNTFNTANVTNMGGMFNKCSGLTSLDLNSFNTAKVTDMDLMFGNCSNLTTIMVGNGWSTESVIYSDDMFTDCANLVGGMGTTYDENHVEADYAHIDAGPSNPGYFTEWKEAYACYTSDNKTLTFYYDNQRSTRPGTTYDLNEGSNYPAWRNISYLVTSVVFDPSFAAARPTTTYSWFSYMYLSSISGIENLNTSQVTNMAAMFETSGSLTSLDLSSFNTANVTDMSNMFSSCQSLTSIDLSSFNTSKVTNMGYMFNYCTGLTSLDLSNFNTSNVTTMSGMFGYCKGLTSLDLSSFNTSNVTSMMMMFQYSDGLTSLDLSSFNTENVTDMSFMFYSCKGLTSLDLSNFNTANVTTMNTMFGDCIKLTSLDLSNFNNANVTTMRNMFNGCKGLTSLDLNGFNTENVTNMVLMFYDCQSLTSLDISSFNTAKVEEMTGMFNSCKELTTIIAGDGWSTDALLYTNTMFYGCTKIVGGMGTTYDYQNVGRDYTYAHIDGGPSNPGYFTDINATMEAYAVYTPENTTLTFYCDGQRNSRPGTTYDLNTGSNQPGWIVDEIYLDVTQVLFDPSFADARPVSTHAWFFCMANVQSITGLEYLNTSEVTKMGAMFMGCESITSLDLRHFNTENVTDMFNMFNSCCNLTSLDVSRFNTAKVIDMRGMFVECSKLTSLDLSSFNTAKVENMNTMFNCDSRLTTIFVGDEWSTAEAFYSNEMFYGCTSLVGGKGTTYDPNHVDKAYAHIDGGPSNPGYFTDKSDFLRGDVDGDGFVKISDVTALIDYLLTGNAADINLDAADCDLDGDVKISDVTELIDYLLRGFWW